MIMRRNVSALVAATFLIGVFVFLFIRFETNAPYPLRGIVDAKSVVRCETRRHGLDVIRVYELLDDDSNAARIISRWKMMELDENSDGPISFATSKSSDWWMRGVTSTWKRYGASDEVHEEYWSMWKDTESNRIFLEIGQW